MRKFQVKVNGNTYEVEVEELQGTGSAMAPSVAPTTSAPVVAPVVAPAAAQAQAGAVKIEAPMQGKIVAVKVSEGEKVAEGDVMVILEAMKMENEIIAPSAGTVASINVAAGQAVESLDILMTLN